MCQDWYLRRRRGEEEESSKIWRDFERTTPISDPQPPEVTEPEHAEFEPAETAGER